MKIISLHYNCASEFNIYYIVPFLEFYKTKLNFPPYFLIILPKIQVT